MNVFQKAVQWAKKSFPFPGRQFLYFSGNGLRDERDYGRLVGDGSGNSIVAGCIQFIMRTFPEAPPAVWKTDAEGIRQRDQASDLVNLMRRPNPFYSGVHLWMATLTSWFIDGNAYWLKIRSPLGKVVQLWYIPHWLVDPQWSQDGNSFIDYYNYNTTMRTLKVPVSEIVHLRWGLDPENVRKGRSPLYAVMREVYTDEEAARFSVSMLKNMGVPGVIVSPMPTAGGGFAAPMGVEDAKAAKEKFKQDYGGDNRGEPIIFSKPTQIQTFGFSPRDLDLSAIRDVPEERVTAVLGLPAAVVGFGTGLQQTKVGATMAELRDQAWEGCLIPSQRIMAADVETQLLPDFYPHPELMEFGFDLSRVRALQEDQGKIAQRYATLFLGGILKRKEARAPFDLISDPVADDFYATDLGIGLSPRGMPKPPVIPADPAAQAASQADSAGNDTATNASTQTINELTQQINDLQEQLDNAEAP